MNLITLTNRRTGNLVALNPSRISSVEVLPSAQDPDPAAADSPLYLQVYFVEGSAMAYVPVDVGGEPDRNSFDAKIVLRNFVQYVNYGR